MINTAKKDVGLAEVAASNRIVHPCAARVIDTIKLDDGRTAIVEDYYPGPNLEQLVRRAGHLSEERFNKIFGQGEKMPLDTRYDLIGGGPGWAMIVEKGFYARTELFAKGISAFISVRDNGDDTFGYTVCRMSEFVNFPLPELFARYNREEGIDLSSGKSWGGGDSVGGSPMGIGSKLSPKSLESITNDELAKHVSE